MPYSHPEGKAETLAWIRRHVHPAAAILDVGPGSGYWGRMLRGAGYQHVDAVEVWAPYVEQFNLRAAYNRVDVADICNYAGRFGCDLAILGDVLEHLPILDAQALVRELCAGTRMVVASVPWRYPQGPEHGNPYETHVQDDLTPEVMAARYPELCPLFLGQVLGVYVRSA